MVGLLWRSFSSFKFMRTCHGPPTPSASLRRFFNPCYICESTIYFHKYRWIVQLRTFNLFWVWWRTSSVRIQSRWRKLHRALWKLHSQRKRSSSIALILHTHTINHPLLQEGVSGTCRTCQRISSAEWGNTFHQSYPCFPCRTFMFCSQWMRCYRVSFVKICSAVSGFTGFTIHLFYFLTFLMLSCVLCQLGLCVYMLSMLAWGCCSCALCGPSWYLRSSFRVMLNLP